MRALVQRVKWARVRVDGKLVGAIDEGLLVLLGVGRGDGEREADWLARKLPRLRLFPDERGRMNRSLAERGGRLLVVSQFTLYGDLRRGNRPSFSGAAEPGRAEALYRRLCERLEAEGFPPERGVFGAMMEVELLNWGPVTLLVETPGSAASRPVA